MGRPKIKIDEMDLVSLREQGKSLQEISVEMGVSIPTLSRRIAYLRFNQGILTKYRELKHLHLTELQFKIIEAIFPKIERASVLELIKLLDVLLKAEKQFIEGKEKNKGSLLAHLEAMERERSRVQNRP